MSHTPDKSQGLLFGRTAPSFHNTTGEKARHQEVEILNVFKLYRERLTPCRVWRIIGERYPLTSVRRAITNLTNRRELRKTDEKKVGVFGSKVHTWELL